MEAIIYPLNHNSLTLKRSGDNMANDNDLESILDQIEELFNDQEKTKSQRKFLLGSIKAEFEDLKQASHLQGMDSSFFAIKPMISYLGKLKSLILVIIIMLAGGFLSTFGSYLITRFSGNEDQRKYQFEANFVGYLKPYKALDITLANVDMIKEGVKRGEIISNDHNLNRNLERLVLVSITGVFNIIMIPENYQMTKIAQKNKESGLLRKDLYIVPVPEALDFITTREQLRRAQQNPNIFYNVNLDIGGAVRLDQNNVMVGFSRQEIKKFFDVEPITLSINNLIEGKRPPRFAYLDASPIK